MTKTKHRSWTIDSQLRFESEMVKRQMGILGIQWEQVKEPGIQGPILKARVNHMIDELVELRCQIERQESMERAKSFLLDD